MNFFKSILFINILLLLSGCEEIEPLIVSTDNSSSISCESATISGTVTNTEKEVSVGFIYDICENLSENTGKKSTILSSNSSFSTNIEKLFADTIYYYRAYAIDKKGKFCLGNIKQFRTLKAPKAITKNAVFQTSTQVYLFGEVYNNSEDIKVGFVYDTTNELSETKGKQLTTTSKGNFSIIIVDLEYDTTYYYRSFAYVNGKYYWGEIKSFKTEREMVVTNNAIFSQLNMEANFYGIVSNVTEEVEVGFIYDTSNNVSETKGNIIKTKSKGAFNLTIKNLKYGTTYYYRAFAYIGGKYYLGEIKSFKTQEVIVETGDAIVYETTMKARLSGSSSNVYQDIKVGIIYDTSNNLSETKGKQLTTTDHGYFSFTIENLNHGTTYYYRAFAYVDGKYYWGETKSFKTKTENSPNLEPGEEL